MADTVRLPLAEPDYFPLRGGYRLRYSHASTRFEGIETVEIEFTDVRVLKDVSEATAVLTRTFQGRSSRQAYRVRRDRAQVFSEGGVLGIARQEFRRPPAIGLCWTQPEGAQHIAALDAVIEVPAGKFGKCLRVHMLLAGGGTAIRYYAPEIGYVYEEFSEKNAGSRVSLLAYGA